MSVKPEFIEEGTTVDLNCDQLEDAAFELVDGIMNDLGSWDGRELTPLQERGLEFRIWEYLTRLGFGGRSAIWEDQRLLDGRQEKEISSP